MTRSRRDVLAVIVLPLVLAACGSSGSAASATASSPASSTTGGPVATAPTMTTPPALTTPPGDSEVVVGPGEFFLSDPLVGLDALSSYRASLIVSFTGSADGVAQQWASTSAMVVSEGARGLTVENTGALDAADPAWSAEVDGVAYGLISEGGCVANVIDPEDPLAARAPATVLTGVVGADAAGGDVVNGVEADGYTFDQRALGLPGEIKATGQIWVATEGGFIVRYLVTTSAGAEYFGDGIEGTISWDYQLTDVGKPVAVDLPPDCPAGLVGAPQLPDATNVVDLPGSLGYDTAASVAKVVAFYQGKSSGLGWVAVGDPQMSDTVAALEFRSGDRTVTVLASAGDTGTTVQILVGSPEE